MGVQEIVELTDTLVSIRTGSPLSYIQKVILSESLQDVKKTYDQIAIENGYSPSYLKNGAAPKLWNLLSEILGEKISKTNCRFLLEKQLIKSGELNQSGVQDTSEVTNIESPEGQVPLTSRFYIERAPIESTCYQEIQKPRSLIRIKAPRKMGKTSLMVRILDFAQNQGFKTVKISLNRAESEVLSSSEKFLRWLCANSARQLGLDPKLDEYWNEEMGAIVSCTLYFQSYLFEQINSPIVLALDELNQLFEYPSLRRDLLVLLRSWHEETRDLSQWEKLRILLVSLTEIDLRIDTIPYPFNMGLSVDLPPFTSEQVFNLGRYHGLNLSADELSQLMELVGGFPYLVRLTFYHSVLQQIELKDLIETATSDTGIYSDHLQSQAWYLQENRELAIAFQKVLSAESPIPVDQVEAFKLLSLGLIYLENDRARISCELYRQYFHCKINNPTPLNLTLNPEQERKNRL
ncbi:AAA-like domain-containing protein [Capilliphycus salinus ALCB114379]|uniref:AAA-like domain-containing protein n=1 Tax=Capilliphycus salinus TaxID=2768948 RepID=UPI0039A46677